MDAVAEQADGLAASDRCSQQGRGAVRGSRVRTSRIVPCISRLTSSGVPQASSLPLWISARRLQRSASSR